MFSETQCGVRGLCVVLLWVTEPDLTKKKIVSKMGQMGQKIGFLGFIGNLVITFS